MDDLAQRVAARFEGSSEDDSLSLRVAARFERGGLERKGSFHNKGKFLGRDCRLTWGSYEWKLEELPIKGKKKCKVAEYDNPGARGWPGFDAYIDDNILRDAKLSASDGYETIKQKMLDAFAEAAESTLAKQTEVKHYQWIRDLKWSEHEVHYLKIVPEDTDPIDIEGKDFILHSEWTKFKVYDPKSDLANHDPHYTMYEASSPTAARKLYQMAKADPNILKTVGWHGLSDWLNKNKIPYESHSSSWH